MADRRRRTAVARWPALLAVLAAAGACAPMRMAMGPRVGTVDGLAAPPLAGLEVRDHSERRRLRFLVVGDTGTGEDAQRRVEHLETAIKGIGLA